MDNTIQSDLIRGHINTIILKSLYEGDRYGFDIIKEIEQKSSGRYKLKQPTLYSCLKRLELQGFIASYWGAKSNGGRRKYFTLSEEGKQLYIKNQNEWEYSRTVIDRLISDKTVDLDDMPKTFDFSEQSEEIAEEVSENEFIDNNEAEALTLNPIFAPAPTPVVATSKIDIDSIKFLDTSDIMNKLFEQSESDISYTDKLVTEKYVADMTKHPQPTKDDYFIDFTDEEQPETIVQQQQETLPTAPLVQPAQSYKTEVAKQELTQQAYKIAPESYTTETTNDERQTTEQINETFLKYNESITKETASTSLLEREYKNILGSFADSNFINNVSFTDSVAKKSDVTEIANNKTTKAEIDSVFSADFAEDANTVTAITDDTEVNKKFDKLATDVREMGGNLKIRTHSHDTSKEYSNMYYYHSNKLMLVHYAILFGIMVAEILLTSVIVFAGLKINNKGDILYYICAVIVALIFPTLAFIKNYTSPNKRKRINFSIRNSMIFRGIIVAQCFLIVYCLNLCLGMALPFELSYISTLLLPSLLSTNFIISALIFSVLFKSKKYSIEE